jgi:hypothetical protein
MLIEKIFFEVRTPLDFTVRVSLAYWDLIATVKHPVMAGLERKVTETLEQPEEIRVSKSDSKVFLFYRTQKPGRWICAVVKRLNGEGFLITTYPTDTIKEGEHIWPK